MWGLSNECILYLQHFVLLYYSDTLQNVILFTLQTAIFSLVTVPSYNVIQHLY